jgi:transcriptional regulator with XRE-family HTH domain
MSTDETNLIKSTCKALGLTYRELGERIGYSEGAIRNAVSGDKISEPLQKAIELYTHIVELQEELAKSEEFKISLKKWLKD